MRCPWCDREGPPRALHAHLAERHPEEVRVEERLRMPFYVVVCPLCGQDHRAPIKPRGRDPAFLEEFRREIALVAFDMLVNHLLAEHPSVGEAPGASPWPTGAPAGAEEEGAGG